MSEVGSNSTSQGLDFERMLSQSLKHYDSEAGWGGVLDKLSRLLEIHCTPEIMAIELDW